MEIMKADGCDIQATWWGMAFCGTCHVEVLGPRAAD
jgi:ferredoxin